METVLSMMIRDGLPMEFWAYDSKVVVYLINRMIFKTLNHKSSFKFLYNKKPDYKLLKVYECLCFPYTRPYLNSKFYMSYVPYVFLGYPEHQKGYNYLDPVTKRLYVSPYVVFRECVFHYLSIDISSSVLNSTLPYQVHTQKISPTHFIQLLQSHGQFKTIYNVISPFPNFSMPNDISPDNIVPFQLVSNTTLSSLSNSLKL